MLVNNKHKTNYAVCLRTKAKRVGYVRLSFNFAKKRRSVYVYQYNQKYEHLHTRTQSQTHALAENTRTKDKAAHAPGTFPKACFSLPELSAVRGDSC